MTRILAIEHEAQCPPAHVGTWLTEAGATIEVCRPWAGDELPALTSYDGLVVLGGSMGADDDALHHWLAPVKQLLRDAIDTGLPTLGICLGHQLLAVALGGDVAPNAARPAGRPVRRGVAAGRGRRRPRGRARAGAGRAVEQRRRRRTPRRGRSPWPRRPEGELQLARFGPRAWGVQLHPEVDVPILTSWAAGDRDDHLERGIDQEAVLREIGDAHEELDRAWRPPARALAAVRRRSSSSRGLRPAVVDAGSPRDGPSSGERSGSAWLRALGLDSARRIRMLPPTLGRLPSEIGCPSLPTVARKAVTAVAEDTAISDSLAQLRRARTASPSPPSTTAARRDDGQEEGQPAYVLAREPQVRDVRTSRGARTSRTAVAAYTADRRSATAAPVTVAAGGRSRWSVGVTSGAAPAAGTRRRSSTGRFPSVRILSPPPLREW